MQYRRAKAKGGTYFFTVVTFNRSKIITIPENVWLLREAFRCVMDNHPFEIEAFVLLPDHLHYIWTLPENDMDYSKRWRLIKSFFSRNCHEKYKQTSIETRKRKKEKAVWQRRFWEHLIRDEMDFKKHVEYIHYNPVKHGFVKAPINWKHSSFHQYVKNGRYDSYWGMQSEILFDGIYENEYPPGVSKNETCARHR